MKFPFVSRKTYDDLVSLYVRDNKAQIDELNFLRDSVNLLNRALEDIKDSKKHYYVCIDEGGLESENIYANDMCILDNYFVFYDYGKVVAVMSKNIWVDVVSKEEKGDC